jgi:hypothetical protein
MISDVVGKKNNYIHDPHSDRVIYVDLGCNIVDAHENIMAFKTRHKSPLKKKDRRNAVKKFSRYEIVTKKGEGGKIGLMDFLESPRDMKLLSLNPRGNVRLDSLIPKIEIDEIVERLIAGLYLGKGLSKNGDNIYLNRIK